MFFGRWCLSILLFAMNAFADDVFIIPNGNNDFKPLVRLTGWQGCDVKDPCNPDLDKKAAIKKGFEDMQTMIPAWENVPDPSDPPENAYPVNWDDAAAVKFFGSLQKNGDYRSNIKSKFAIANANGASSFADIMQCRKFEHAGKSIERSFLEVFADGSCTNHRHNKQPEYLDGASMYGAMICRMM